MKNQIWKNYFDIVILPPQGVSEYAIKLSKGLSKYETKWTLGKRLFIPHISLYHIAVKPKHFKAFASEVERTIKNFSPGYLKSTVIESNLLMFDKPAWIQELYLKVIKNTLKYYDWEYRTNEYWSLNHLPKRMQKIGARFIKKYGTPMVGGNFRPHVTLTSFKDNPPKLKVKRARKFKFKPAHIYICKLGPSHSCQMVVKKLFFSK
jgi:hypothetical protein